jgi:probable rRNA maturation factor
MVQVQFSKVPSLPGLRALLQAAAQETLRQQQAAASSELCVVLSGDKELRDLNRQHLGRDFPTDVLSFPAGAIDPEMGAPYLGDVIISVEQAQAQAENAGHSLEAELQLLAVHGILHLLGHDHAGPKEKAAMWQAQELILSSLGVGIDIGARERLEPHE